MTSSTNKTLLEKILLERPELTQVRKEFKIKVLKRVIAYVERTSKNIKPGNYIYTQKLLNISNTPMVKSKFYDILKNDNLDLSTIEMNILLLLIGEMLHSSPEVNINPNLLKIKEFNENLLEAEMNSETFEIFVYLL